MLVKRKILLRFLETSISIDLTGHKIHKSNYSCPPKPTPPCSLCNLQQRFILFIAMLSKELEQLMMVRYAYASRTACLRNRIVISYLQNSKHKSLPNMVFISVYFSLNLSSIEAPKPCLPFSTPSSLITPLSFGGH